MGLKENILFLLSNNEFYTYLFVNAYNIVFKSILYFPHKNYYNHNFLKIVNFFYNLYLIFQ
jgi:hypothetical protein